MDGVGRPTRFPVLRRIKKLDAAEFKFSDVFAESKENHSHCNKKLDILPNQSKK